MARRPRSRNDDLEAILAALEGRSHSRNQAPRETHVDVNVSGSGLTKWAQKVKDLQQLLIALAFVGAASWIFLGPFVNAQAETILKNQLIQIGMDPATVAALNKSLSELQETVKEKDAATDQLSRDVLELKGLIGSVIEFQKLQIVKGAPPVADPVK